MNEPIITTAKELEGKYDKGVIIEGNYRQLNVNKRPGQVTYSGRVYVELSDKKSIVLEKQDAGVRSKDEIEKFEGKKVRVQGKLLKNQLLWGDGTMASIVSDCITDIQLLEEASK